MALIVPDTVPSKASAGEKKLYRILHYELPDDCYVWYEPRIEGVYPDFIVLSPTMGLLILEVKGWHANQIVSGSSQFFDIQNSDRVERQQSPLRQAKLYLDNCLNKLKQYSRVASGRWRLPGAACFPSWLWCNYEQHHHPPGAGREHLSLTGAAPGRVSR